MYTNLEIGAFYGKTNLVYSISQVIKKKGRKKKGREDWTRVKEASETSEFSVNLDWLLD